MAGLQAALVEGLDAGVDLSVDLAPCGVSAPLLQVLWAANNEAKTKGREVTALPCEQLALVLPFSGFPKFLRQTVPAINNPPVSEGA